ncbi:MAG: DUF6340 family protein [Bacteroidales bacterium]|nr:DUF6340 family protein [Bacteroidales bacterium]
MRKLVKLLVSVFVTVIFSSCNSFMVYHMDVLRPGVFVTSSDKKSVLLVDNTGIQPPDFGHAVFEYSRYIQNASFDTEKTSGYLLESVSENLLKENVYQQISISKRQDHDFKKNIDGAYLRSNSLTPALIKKLGDSGDFDLLISLDRLVLHSKTDVRPYEYMHRATRDIFVNSVWRVYDLGADTLLAQFQYNDSLFWENFAPGAKSAAKLLPPMENTLQEIGEYVGEHVSPCFGPFWQSVDRQYFCTGSYRMTYAADLVRQNDWECAAVLWQEEFDKGFGRSVYRAAMNMMLYFDFSGNPKESLVWGKKAESVMEKFFSRPTPEDQLFYLNYSRLLQKRLVEVDQLKRYFKE